MEIKSNESAQSDVEMKSSSEQEIKPKKQKEAKHSPKAKRELDDLKQVSCIFYYNRIVIVLFEYFILIFIFIIDF